MTSSPAFEDDIFISYAHVDNVPLAKGQEGWITLLEERLRILVGQQLGEDIKLWRDPKLQGNDVFSEVLLARLKKVASFISVLSPRYLRSDWCQNELNAFCQHAGLHGGLTLGSQARVFKVVKTYLPRDKHPEPLQSLLGYEFYEYDEGTGRAREFSPDIGPIKDQRYWSKLEDLAWDIKQLLEALRAPPPDTPKATIYLAASTADLSAERDNIKRELQQHGYRVMPDRELPLTVPELEQAVRAYLQQADLSIHLIGAQYGIVPEMEQRSVVRLQYDLATERSRALGFSQLIWMPPGLQAKEERQQAFIDEVQRGQPGIKMEVLQTKLEDLKTVIHAALAPKPNGHGQSDHDSAQVYLLCDKQDHEETKLLEDYLYDLKLEVMLPIDGDPAQVSQYHTENLLLCDALLIYYNRAADPWAQMRRQELLKLPGLGRSKPILAKAFYISGEKTQQKERFRSNEALVIKHYGGFLPDSLAPFLARIQEARGVPQ
jgi:Domain of unknown function (DUF4062)